MGWLALESATRERQLVAQRIEHLTAALAKARTLRDSMEGAARVGGASQVDVLLARRTYQELLLDRTDLDAEAYAAALKVRQAAAVFPRPEGASRATGREEHS
jgi:outer membrane protein TolC